MLAASIGLVLTVGALGSTGPALAATGSAPTAAATTAPGTAATAPAATAPAATAPTVPGAVAPGTAAPGADRTAAAQAADAEHRSAEAAALAEAKRTGKPVGIPALTTETDTVVANPNGTLGLRRTVAPARAKQQDGAWKDLDATLARGADGSVAPKVTSNRLTLSGGGSGPLASLDQDGKKLALSWPGTLPAPALDGETATYAEVVPGVDLKVTANQAGGFTQVLVVKTPEAAKNPRIKDLTLGMRADGVSVSADAGGNLNATDAGGRVVFRAPAPTMWDSSTAAQAPTVPAAPAAAKAGLRTAVATAAAPAGDANPDAAASPAAPSAPAAPAAPADSDGLKTHSDAAGPGAAAKVSQVAATPAGTSLTITPDTAFLDAPTTTYPVYIDPPWTPTSRGTQHWTWVQEAYPTKTHYDDYGDQYDPGVGYQQWQVRKGLERYYFQIDTGDLGDKAIRKASVLATQSYGAANNCASEFGVVLHPTHPIDGSTSWGQQPWDWGPLGTFKLNSAGGDGCPGATATGEWDIRDHLTANNWRGALTFALFAADESEQAGNIGFKRFTRTPSKLPYIYVEYNRAPYKPWSLGMSPTPVNANGNGCGWIGATNAATGIRLSAWVGDPDANQIDAQFEVRDSGAAGEPVVWGSGWGNLGNSNHEAAVVPGNLSDGHTYYWRVQAGDGELASEWAFGCMFSLDLTPPSVPTVTSTDYPPSGTLPGSAKVIGQAGAFTVRSTDNASGILYYEYAFNSAIPVGGAATAYAGGDGSAVLNLTPTMWGTNILRVQAVDRAGNRSQENTYTFYAPSDPNDRTVLGDITNDDRVDLLLPDSGDNLRVYPAATDPGATGILASDKANSPGGKGWKNTLVTHRGGNGIHVDDLYAYRDGELTLYRNTLTTGTFATTSQYFTANATIAVKRPAAGRCKLLDGQACGSAYATDWTRVRQVLAFGSAEGGTPDKTRTDLLTVEDNGQGGTQLWLFRGTAATGVVDNPVLLSTGDWRDLDLIAPGDTTGDGLADLWARDRQSGKLLQYPSRRNAAGKGDLAAFGNPVTDSAIGVGLTPLVYPAVGSSGDLAGDGIADLWALNSSGGLDNWRGTTADGTAATPVSGFAGQPVLGFPGGTVSIHTALTGRCVDARAANDGDSLNLWDCWNGDRQHFTFHSDKTLRVSGKCVTIGADGRIVVQPCPSGPTASATDSQKWELRADGSIQNPSSGSCLDVPQSNGENGTDLALWGCNGGTNQRWTTTANGPSPLHSAVDRRKCVDAFAAYDGAQITVYDCWNGSNQYLTFYTDGTLRVYGKCLAGADNSGDNGTRLILWTCLPGTAGNSQQWAMSGDGAIVNAPSGRCLDLPGGRAENGAELKIWDCNGGPNQKWTTT
ncbi:RICIN domain-containing protein [Kitasatospora purpeofusca]|uniref:RICIN domain-containing protein n=1 Tax=Kitasatospora purpeofusca TaxID=67352 RepID=UPI002A59831B|nr:RICIN domain-containing protein [Kitasatospora purpeofusca]MDY0811851.1 RICIN domain-containing protein [Kitasatospora purpeofusca]